MQRRYRRNQQRKDKQKACPHLSAAAFPTTVYCFLVTSLSYVLATGISSNTSKYASSRSDLLHQLNDSIEALVQRVSPAIVQIQVTGYGSAEEPERGQTDLLVGRRRAIGSGVIVDPTGYIVTNAHVVSGAQLIEVIVPPRVGSSGRLDPAQGPQGKSYQARIVGTSKEIDLAVLKIDAHDLAALSIASSPYAGAAG